MFVCLQRDAKQCCGGTKLDCTHCAGRWPAQWVLSNIVPAQHCLASFWRQTNIKISRDLGALSVYLVTWWPSNSGADYRTQEQLQGDQKGWRLGREKGKMWQGLGASWAPPGTLWIPVPPLAIRLWWIWTPPVNQNRALCTWFCVICADNGRTPEQPASVEKGA